MPEGCIFCGAKSPTVKITKEHIYSGWYANLFPEETEFVVTRGEPSDEREYAGVGSIPIASNAVCEPCNTGWMSDLEHNARPVLEPMIRGIDTTLSPAEQGLVAAWFMLKVMTLDAGDHPPEQQFWSQAERQHFRHVLIPLPVNVIDIWLARYVGGWGRTQGHPVNFDLRAEGEVTRTAPGYVSTHAIGQLAFQLRCVRWPKDLPQWATLEFSIPNGWDRCTVHIWPVTDSANWPPAEVLDDEAFDLLTYRWDPAKPAI